MGRLRLLFVCRGNTCRSPMAECIMQYLSEENELNWTCDSAGLRNWGVGRRPDERCLQVLDENGMTTSHYGRLVSKEDFMSFDFIFAMDEQSMTELEALMSNLAGKKARAKIIYLSSYLRSYECKAINDPFFSRNLNGFRCTYSQILESCENFIEEQKLNNSGTDEPLVQNF